MLGCSSDVSGTRLSNELWSTVPLAQADVAYPGKRNLVRRGAALLDRRGRIAFGRHRRARLSPLAASRGLFYAAVWFRQAPGLQTADIFALLWRVLWAGPRSLLLFLTVYAATSSAGDESCYSNVKRKTSCFRWAEHCTAQILWSSCSEAIFNMAWSGWRALYWQIRHVGFKGLADIF